MQTLVQLLIIAISLSLDSFSVSIAGGITSQKARVSHAAKVALFFGVFQAVMPIIGWIIGAVLSQTVRTTGHWAAFFLLLFIGVKMIRETFAEDKEKRNILEVRTLVVLAIATSIDALIVGISLSLLAVPFLVSITTIGIVTFILCFLGFLFGRQLGTRFGQRVEILGGLALIAIGIKVLLLG